MRLRQQTLGKVDPLLQLSDALMQGVHLSGSELKLLDFGPECGVARLAFQPPTECAH